MRLILFATLGEALPTIELLRAQSEEKRLYNYAGGRIVITGYGALAALSATLKEGVFADEIWNVGLAGTLVENLPLGSIHQVSCVTKATLLVPHDPIASECHATHLPELSLVAEGVKLVTVDIPIHDEELRARLAKKGMLVDMEGYGVAYAARLLNKPVTLWKGVSDFASPGGRALIAQTKERLATHLAEIIGSVIS